MNTFKQEDETWTAVCERFGCGGFTTSNHPTKKAATERLGEHDAEHDAGTEAELQDILKEGN